jgi:hypothetical protein
MSMTMRYLSALTAKDALEINQGVDFEFISDNNANMWLRKIFCPTTFSTSFQVAV